MENIISLVKVKELILEIIKEFSIDALYLGKHPLFISLTSEPSSQPPFTLSLSKLASAIFKENNKKYDFFNRDIDYKFGDKIKYQRNTSFGSHNNYLFVEFHDKQMNFDLVDEILSKTKKHNNPFSEKEKETFYQTLLTDWINKQNGKMEEYLENKKNKIKSLEERIEEVNNKINKNCNVKNILDEEITTTEEQIKDLPDKEKNISNTIQEKDNEIKTLESFKNKDQYESAIKKVKKARETLLSNFKKEKESLIQKKAQLDTKLSENNKWEKDLNTKISTFKEELKELSGKSFDLAKEEEAFDFIQDILRFNEQEASKPVAERVFVRIYNPFTLLKQLEWKQTLLKLLEGDIPEPSIFYITRLFSDITYPKLAQVLSPHLFEKQNLGNLETKLFPIWFSLREALLKNRIIKTSSGIFYISFHNGTFARIMVRDSKKANNEEVTVALKYICDKRGFYSNQHLFELLNGVYIHYQGYAFEIDFFDNPLLLQGFTYQKEEDNSTDSHNYSDDDDD